MLVGQLEKECTDMHIRTAFLKGKETALRKSVKIYQGVINRLTDTFDINTQE